MKWNYYRCPDCTLAFTTLDVDDGVTPMFLRCRRVTGCRGWAQSAMYPDPATWPADVPREPLMEFYRPNPLARRMMRNKTPDLYEHVRKGGLILRPPKTNTKFPESDHGQGREERPRVPEEEERAGPQGGP